MSRILRFILMCSIVLIALGARVVSAHATPDHSEPRVGSTVDKPPTEVRIWFNEKIEPAFSAIEVFGADGKQIDKKDSHVDAKENRLLIVSVGTLAPGTYRVAWHVVSVDTHKTSGDFKFTVKPQ